MQFHNRNGVSLAYEDSHHGPSPILFVHGWGCDHSFFAPQIKFFRPRHRVVAVDLSGHGCSGAPSQDYTMAGFADDLAWLCAELALDRPVVVGHSMGGTITLEFAGRYSELLATAVLIDSVILPPPGFIFAGLATWSGAAAADAKSDHSYRKLKKAILSGKNISMTVDLAACHIHGTDKPGPGVRGSLHFEAFMIEADQSIAFATTHFTVKSDNTPMDEFLSFRIQPSGAIIARTRFLNASTYDVLHDSEFDCSIGNGTKFYW